MSVTFRLEEIEPVTCRQPTGTYEVEVGDSADSTEWLVSKMADINSTRLQERECWFGHGYTVVLVSELNWAFLCRG